MKIRSKALLIGFWIASISNVTLAESSKIGSTESEGSEYRSPLFIDDVHCEGLTFDADQTWYLTDAEKEIEKKMFLRKSCLETLSFFGVKLHSWISQEDLDNVSIMMRTSGFFEITDLWIKKSDLKNHVHLFVKITEKKSKVHQINMQVSTYKGSPRLNNLDKNAFLSKFDYTYSKKSRPSSEQRFSLGKNNIFDGTYKLNNSTYELSPEIRDIYQAQMKINDLSLPISSEIEFNLFQQKYNKLNEKSKLNSDYEMEGKFFNTQLYGLNTKMVYGMSFHYFNDQKIENLFSGQDEENKSVLAPGIFYRIEIGSDDTYKVKLSIDGNAIISKEDKRRVKTNLEVSQSLSNYNYFGSQVRFGLSTISYKNYQSALGRSNFEVPPFQWTQI